MMPDVLAQMGGAFRDPGIPSAPRPPGPAFQTRLSPQEETQFQDWVRMNKIPWQDTPVADYDMRGFWRGMMQGRVERNPETMHFPDVYKTPFHQTFSNESQYAYPGAPRWEQAGERWRLISPATGRVIKEE